MLPLTLLILLAACLAAPLSKRAGKIISTGLAYSKTGSYFIPMTFGDTDIALAPDTGSSLTWLPDKSLKGFKFTFQCSSPKCKLTNDDYSVEYVDGTKALGKWIDVENTMVGDEQVSVKYPVAIVSKYDSTIDSALFGNLGLSMPSFETQHDTTNLVKALYTAGKIPSWSLAVYFRGDSSLTIDFGGYIPSKGVTPMTYTDITPYLGHHHLPYVYVNNIYLNDKTPLNFHGQSLVDTGAINMNVPASVYNTLLKECGLTRNPRGIYPFCSAKTSTCYLTFEFPYSKSQRAAVVQEPASAASTVHGTTGTAHPTAVAANPATGTKNQAGATGPKAISPKGPKDMNLLSSILKRGTTSGSTGAGASGASPPGAKPGNTKTATPNQYFRVRVPLGKLCAPTTESKSLLRIASSLHLSLGTSFLEQAYTHFDYAQNRVGFSEMDTVAKALRHPFNNRVTNGPLSGTANSGSSTSKTNTGSKTGSSGAGGTGSSVGNTVSNIGNAFKGWFGK